MENQKQQTSIEQRMRTAPLSQQTREYLIVIGKFNDALSDLYCVTQKDYTSMIDDVLKPTLVQFNALEAELYKLVALNISDGMNMTNKTEI